MFIELKGIPWGFSYPVFIHSGQSCFYFGQVVTKPILILKNLQIIQNKYFCYIKISALIFLCAQGSHDLEAIPAVTLPCLAQGPMWY